MKWALSLLHIFLFLSCSSYAQEYSYTQYNIKDGLAGSIVYSIVQDKDGFLWMCTETGISRFDGTHFKNFSTSDGLPDIEILRMFVDSRGRVWMAPFRKSVCYYFKGKIYNQDNDTTLQKIKLGQKIENFAEDSRGNILMVQKNAIAVLAANGEVKEYSSINNELIQNCFVTSRSLTGNFLVQESGKLYEFVDGQFRLIMSIPTVFYSPGVMALTPKLFVWRDGQLNAHITSMSTGKNIDLDFSYTHSSYSIINDSLVYDNGSTGSIEYNVNKPGETRKFLPGVETSNTFHDSEGNTWFATIGEGVFKLNSNEFRNITLPLNITGNYSVHSITKINNKLYLGANQNRIWKIDLPGYATKSSYRLMEYEIKNRVWYIDSLQNGEWVYGSEQYMARHSKKNGWRMCPYLIFFKKMCRVDSHRLLIVTARDVIAFDPYKFIPTDTIWNDRATTVYYRNDTTYIGTLNGLYVLKKNRSVIYLGKSYAIFKERIADITEAANGSLWIATYGSGIAEYRDNKIITTIKTDQGLTSNICSNLFYSNNTLWIGTDKGLNKIDLDKKDYPITTFTSRDGLSSDIINAIYVDDTMTYVGTHEGLSFFDEHKLSSGSYCKLVLLDIINSGKHFPVDSANFELPHSGNNVRFEYAGISYKSSGNITYRYKLTGLDTGWKYTKETFLDYPTLPPGNYRLQLLAINKFKVVSRPITISFSVETPFWRSNWFYILSISLGGILVWLLMLWRIKSIRKTQNEKEQVRKKMIEMEQASLSAQMNPHFIFNCLNSIQQYVFEKDIFAVNKYITGFAKLIRTTLQNSTSTFISLAEEIDYLLTYLELEKLRFKDKMDYSIEIDQGLKKETLIPAMILQPYIENSIRHGIRHKLNGK